MNVSRLSLSRSEKKGNIIKQREGSTRRHGSRLRSKGFKKVLFFWGRGLGERASGRKETVRGKVDESVLPERSQGRIEAVSAENSGGGSTRGILSERGCRDRPGGLAGKGGFLDYSARGTIPGGGGMDRRRRSETSRRFGLTAEDNSKIR